MKLGTQRRMSHSCLQLISPKYSCNSLQLVYEKFHKAHTIDLLRLLQNYNMSSYYQDKVILGTDYPFPLGELEPGKLIDSMEDFDNKLKV